MADLPADEAVKDKWSLSEYFERTWGQVEKGIEEAVQRSLGVLKVPRRETLQEFAARLDAIEKRISALEGKGG
jgi:polyhydroxyalkanoate synthesis regulator phasin